MNIKLLLSAATMALAATCGAYASDPTHTVVTRYWEPDGEIAAYDLSVYDRLNFYMDRLELISSADATVEPITFSYERYDNYYGYLTLRFDDRTAIESVKAADGSQVALTYLAGESALKLGDSAPEGYGVAVFGIDGTAVVSGRFDESGRFTLPSLGAGVYVGLATDGINKCSTLFVIR